MSIIVKTQIGTGGNWHVEGEWNTGPRNLMAAVRCAHEAMAHTSAVGGYRTLIVVNGTVLSYIEDGWPSTMAEAKKALA